MGHVESSVLNVEVVYCPQPGRTLRASLQLTEGATVEDAVAASGLCAPKALAGGALQVGIWGRVQLPQTRLRDRDRVELYRPLLVDPKEARRLRYKRAKRADAA